MALGLAAVLAMGTCVPVLAENTKGGDVNLSYTAAESYTIEIPSGVQAITESGGSLEFKLTEGVLDPNHTITIAPASKDVDLTLQDHLESKCTVTLGDNVTFTNDKRTPQTMSVTLNKDNVTVAGEYTGIVTFTVTSDVTSA